MITCSIDGLVSFNSKKSSLSRQINLANGVTFIAKKKKVIVQKANNSTVGRIVIMKLRPAAPKPNKRLVIKLSNDVTISYPMISTVAIMPSSTSCNFFINDMSV